MLTALNTQINKPVFAHNPGDKGATFVCRSCNHPVMLCYDYDNGIPFFAHTSAVRCPVRKKDGPKHQRCKMAIYQTLSKFRIPNQIECNIEKNVCADVLVSVNGIYTAIEIEHSRLTTADIERITRAYTAKSIPVLWLMLDGRPDENGIYRPREYERTIADMRQGVILFWRGGISLTSALLAPHLYYPTKTSYLINRPKVYKRTNRILFGLEPISITSLVPRTVSAGFNQYLLATEPRTIQWPVLEKPFAF